MTKPPTPAAQRRKIERLEAENAILRERISHRDKATLELIYEKVDYEMRVKHAMQILTGEEES